MDFELLKTLTILYVEDELSLQEDIYQNISPLLKRYFELTMGKRGFYFFLNIKIVLTYL